MFAPREMSEWSEMTETDRCAWGACFHPNTKMVPMRQFTDECGHVVGMVCAECEETVMETSKGVCDCNFR